MLGQMIIGLLSANDGNCPQELILHEKVLEFGLRKDIRNYFSENQKFSRLLTAVVSAKLKG
jgi:hypothetical protein